MTQQRKFYSASVGESRRAQLMVGLAILTVFILTVPTFYLCWRLVPGLFGDWLGVIAGVMSTPFLLEFFFIIIGLIVVVGLNQYRQRKDGDDFVYLEQVDDTHSTATLPDHSKFAIYAKRPLDGVAPTRIDGIEGALEIGDHVQASEWLAEMSDQELRHPDVLALRLRLARATGKTALAQRIENEIQASTPP